jgi:hypothetical protein
MANGEFVYLKPSLSVGGTDISAWIQSATADWMQNIIEFIASNPGAGSTWKRRLPGAQDYKVDTEISDDLTATTGLHAILWALRGTTFTVVFKPNGSTTSTTNPKATFTALLDHVPFGGGVNTQAKKTVSFMLADGSVAVATSD